MNENDAVPAAAGPPLFYSGTEMTNEDVVVFSPPVVREGNIKPEHQVDPEWSQPENVGDGPEGDDAPDWFEKWVSEASEAEIAHVITLFEKFIYLITTQPWRENQNKTDLKNALAKTRATIEDANTKSAQAKVTEAITAQTMPTDSDALATFVKAQIQTVQTHPKEQARRKQQPAAKAKKGKKANAKEQNNSNGKNNNKGKTTTNGNENKQSSNKTSQKRKGAGQGDQSKGTTKNKQNKKNGNR